MVASVKALPPGSSVPASLQDGFTAFLDAARSLHAVTCSVAMFPHEAPVDEHHRRPPTFDALEGDVPAAAAAQPALDLPVLELPDGNLSVETGGLLRSGLSTPLTGTLSPASQCAQFAYTSRPFIDFFDS